ncbi:MAG: hypothetical protein WBE86_14280 [Candidatus Acidiferrales bacterium]
MRRSAFQRKPSDLYPEIFQRLQQEFVAKAAAEHAIPAAAKTQHEIHTSRPSFSEGGQPSTQNPDPQQIPQQKSKDK